MFFVAPGSGPRNGSCVNRHVFDGRNHSEILAPRCTCVNRHVFDSPYLDALTCYYNNHQNCRWCFAPSDITALARHSLFFNM